MFRHVTIALAILCGAWMIFDGARALVVGDYVTPSGGEYAGRLGPWADLLRAAGVDPRATFVKAAFVVIGTAWLAAAVGLIRSQPRSARLLLVAAAASFWYLPFGTLIAVVALIFGLRR